MIKSLNLFEIENCFFSKFSKHLWINWITQIFIRDTISHAGYEVHRTGLLLISRFIGRE
jgi:hypothetical protein